MVELIKKIVKSSPLLPFAKWVYRRYRRFIGKRHPLQDVEASDKYPLMRLGTEYGGWTFVNEPSLSNSIIVSAGLGEDASFDVEFAKKYDAKVIIVDPTPRAIKHFKKIKQSLGEPKKQTYVQGGEQPVSAYNLSNINPSQLVFIEKALWNEKTKIEFYKPKVDSHVSHSITNWPHDYSNETDSIEVQADTITSVIDGQDVDREDIPLVKLDIEGAEIEVIEQMINDNFLPRQILVEFDELHNPSDKAYRRVDKTHELLLENRYSLLYTDGYADFLYFREDENE